MSVPFPSVPDRKITGIVMLVGQQIGEFSFTLYNDNQYLKYINIALKSS